MNNNLLDYVPDGTPERAFWRVIPQWVGDVGLESPREMLAGPVEILAVHVPQWRGWRDRILLGDARDIRGNGLADADWIMSNDARVEQKALERAFRTGRLTYRPDGQWKEKTESVVIAALHVYEEPGDMRMKVDWGSDSLCDGYVFVPLSAAREHYNWQYLTSARKAELRTRINYEVGEYSDYLQGNVWRVVTQEATRQENGTWAWVDLDDECPVYGLRLSAAIRNAAIEVALSHNNAVDTYEMWDEKLAHYLTVTPEYARISMGKE